MASSERDERRRNAFARYAKSTVAGRFVFVDECSTNVSLSPIYARAPRGERARGKAPRNYWGKNVSPICAINPEGVKPSMSVEGGWTADLLRHLYPFPPGDAATRLRRTAPLLPPCTPGCAWPGRDLFRNSFIGGLATGIPTMGPRAGTSDLLLALAPSG